METNNPNSSRSLWIISCLVLLLATICCGAFVVIVTSGGLIAYLAPLGWPTEDPMHAESWSSEPQITVLAPELPSPSAPTATPPAATNFTNNKGRSQYPSTATDTQGNIHVIWLDDSLRGENGKYDILHRQLAPNGQWSEVNNLSSDFETIIESSVQMLTTPDERPCIFWLGNQFLAGGPSAHLRCWDKTQWSKTENPNLEDDIVYEASPAFDADGKLEVAFSSFGEWRLQEQRLIPDPRHVYGLKFLIDTQNGYHLLWHQGDPNELWHRYSTDQGNTWEDVIQLSGKEANDSLKLSSTNIQAINSPNGNLHLAWPGQDGIYYRLWQTDNGWQAPQKILDQKQSSGHGISLAVDKEGQPHLMFIMTVHGPREIGHIQQQSDGEWTWPKLVTFAGHDEAINSSNLALVIDHKGQKHFVWQVSRIGQVNTNPDLYYTTLP